MTAPINNFPNGITEDDDQVVKVTVLHEDLPMALQARALFDCVLPHLGSGARLDLDFWRFEALRDPALRNHSTNAAQDCGIVVFAISNRKILPPEVEEWISEWLRCRSNPSGAFVVLLATENDSKEKPPIFHQLYRTAEEIGAEFFCEFCDPANKRLRTREEVSPELGSRWTPHLFAKPAEEDQKQYTA